MKNADLSETLVEEDLFQQGEISFVTFAGLEMKEIRQGYKKTGRKTPYCLNLIFPNSYK